MKLDEVMKKNDAGNGVTWIDIEGPSPDDLRSIAKKYNLPRHAVSDCLDPEHFPKFESFCDLNFLVLRCFDDASSLDADTVQELTRKIAVFESPNFVLTIHRSSIGRFNYIKDYWRAKDQKEEEVQESQVLLSILNDVVTSYQKPMDQNRSLLETFEVKVFRHDGDTFEDGYFLKRRASAFKRVLRMTVDILPKLANQYPKDSSIIQDARENGERLYAYAEEFYENVTSLVGLQLALSNHRLTVASFRANEVMRILTVFSVFFMPLNLVTGIYGMNFENMPELKWENGYYLALVGISLITITILIYFKRKGVLDAPTGANNDSL